MKMKKIALIFLALLLLVLPVSAAEVTEARVPVTLTVVNTVSPISVTVPAALPISLVDNYIVTASNAQISNNAKTGSVKITGIEVQAGTFQIGSYDSFAAEKDTIALNINGFGTKGAGKLDLSGSAPTSIAPGESLPIRYRAKVSTSEVMKNVNAATVIFTIAAAD